MQLVYKNKKIGLSQNENEKPPLSPEPMLQLEQEGPTVP
jgi:hypothetical protein